MSTINTQTAAVAGAGTPVPRTQAGPNLVDGVAPRRTLDASLDAIRKLSIAAGRTGTNPSTPELVLVSDGPVDLSGPGPVTVTLHPPEQKPELIAVSDGPVDLSGPGPVTVTLHPVPHDGE